MWQELQLITQLHFDYKGMSSLSENAISRFAANLNFYPPEEVFFNHYSYDNFDQAHIINLIEEMINPKNSIFIITGAFDEGVSDSDMKEYYASIQDDVFNVQLEKFFGTEGIKNWDKYDKLYNINWSESALLDDATIEKLKKEDESV